MCPKSKLRDASSMRSANKLVMIVSALALLPFTMVMLLEAQFSASDPGVRGGPPSAGGPLPSVSVDPTQLSFFNDGKDQFNEIQSVGGTIDGEPGLGLGPRFNSNSCTSCHAQPDVGGTSPSPDSPQNPGPNPEVAVATLDGATNAVPFFVSVDGPAREARFKFLLNPDGTLSNRPDGGVHDLYTITGRVDATDKVGITGQPQTCVITQPNFERMRDLNNLIFRIPTPVFGGGLIDNIADAAILENMDDNKAAKRELGIFGHPNTNGNDGTITRFGWKAQNKSLLLFSGEAYNVEMGVTNELFQSERSNPPLSCMFNPTPEDPTNFKEDDPVKVLSNVVSFANFMRFLDQPTPACAGSDCSLTVQNGRRLFVDVVRCGLCHTPTLRTTASSITSSLNFANANLFSDLLVHRMGSGLADGISQGAAGPNEFRTAPLWGLGQRIFFLHDGRTSDLLEAIREHASRGSEANRVIAKFDALPEDQKQDVLNFLRSL